MEEIQAKISEILSRQLTTEQMVSELQTVLYEGLLSGWGDVITPDGFEAFYDEFNLIHHKPIISKMVSDMDYILNANLDYFFALGLTKQAGIKIIDSMVKGFGVDESGKLTNGYFKNVLQDTSIKRTVWDYISKQSNNKKITANIRAELKAIIRGKDGQLGIFEKMYTMTDRVGSSIFDIYQRADRIAQAKFAKELGLQAAIYTGGIIAGTRPFCAERNGKIYLVSEIKKWVSLSFQGKPIGYDPIKDLGGYRCRHFWAWLSNETAMRLDSSLKINKDGKLYRAAS